MKYHSNMEGCVKNGNEQSIICFSYIGYFIMR